MFCHSVQRVLEGEVTSTHTLYTSGHQEADRGPDPDPAAVLSGPPTYSRFIIETYYLVTERFYFNPRSFSSIYCTGSAAQETYRPIASSHVILLSQSNLCIRVESATACEIHRRRFDNAHQCFPQNDNVTVGRGYWQLIYSVVASKIRSIPTLT